MQLFANSRISRIVCQGLALVLLSTAAPLSAQLGITTTRLTDGVADVAYPATPALQAAGGSPPYTFTLTAGPLPAGMNFSVDRLAGVPTALGNFPLTFMVTDSVSATASRSFTLAVKPDSAPPPPAWEVRGLLGGTAKAIIASPDYVSDGTLFSLNASGEIYRTTTQGQSWGRFAVNPATLDAPLSLLRLSPVYSQNGSANPEVQTVFVIGAKYGVWKSVDHGATFTASNTGLPCSGAGCVPAVNALAVSPAYATDRTVWSMLFASPSSSLYRSLDGGANWSLHGTIAGGNQVIAALEVSPDFVNDGTLIAYGYNPAALYQSTDGGVSWNVLSSGITGYPLQMLFSPDYASDGTILVSYFTGSALGVLRSQNRGVSFQPLPAAAGGGGLTAVRRSGLPPLWTIIQAGDPGFDPAKRVYALLQSDDAFTSAFRLYSRGLPPGMTAFSALQFALAATPVGAGGAPDLYIGGSQGVYGSADNGFSFSARNSHLNSLQCPSLSGAGTRLGAAAAGGFLLSSDGGNNWSRPAPGADSRFIALSPNSAIDHLLFVQTRQGALQRSTDDGGSFTAVGPAVEDYVQAAFAPGFNSATGTVFFARRRTGGVLPGGLVKSVDGGRTLTQVTSAAAACPLTTTTDVYSVVLSPDFAADQTMFIATPASFSPMFGGVCKSTDGGTTWAQLTQFGGLFPLNPGVLALSPVYSEAGANGTPAKTLLLDSIGGQFFRSTDGGANWGSPAGVPLGAFGAPVFSPLYALDGTVFLAAGEAATYPGTVNGVFRSSDFGASFAPLGAADQLKGRLISGLYLLPNFDGRNSAGSDAVAVTNGGGMWRSTDGGRSFLVQEGFKLVSNFPTGFAAGGNNLWTSSQDEGMFRSNDGGNTFTRTSAGLPAGAGTLAVAAPGAGDAPVAALAGQGLYRYSSGLWSPVATAGAGTFNSFAADGGFLYAARSDGASLRSADNGATWVSQDPTQTDLVNIDFNNQAGPTLIVPPAILKSASSIEHRASIIVSTNTASLWSVSQSGGARYSTNNGANWITANGSGDYALPAGATFTTVRVLGINAASGSREVLVGTATGLFRSIDGGLSWRSVSSPGSGLESTSRNFSTFVTSQTPANTTDILAGILGATTGGVYLSSDGGEHWTQINQGFDPNNLNITTLIKTSCSGCPVQYYSGTYGSGVYTRTIAVNPAPSFPSVNAACYGSTGCACAATAGSGPESGGQAFKLCGAGFLALATVEFDGVAATGCTRLDAATITCLGTPPHFPGAVAVRVRNTDTRVGYLPSPYTYVAGGPRASGLTVAKSGTSAVLGYSCPGCVTPPPQIYRSQNAPFNLNVEQYTGGAASYTNIGALAAGSNGTYYWSVE